MKPLILLHGAIGAGDQLEPLATLLSSQYDVHVIDFSGHGAARPTVELFSMELFANDVRAYMLSTGLERASIFGHSMGGYVAMYLARHSPELIDCIVTLATKWHWDEATAAKETRMLNADKIEQKVPSFAETLHKRHAAHGWKNVLAKTADMMLALGADNPLKAEDHAAITQPSLILLGDRDKMVSLEETLAVYKALPNGQMGMLPGTGHPVEQVDIEVLHFFINRFLR
ncbi:MAG: alpha/beta fold hydrolase [Taibaiella sp.]|nr:alpha/beta fold hydrolase [Taibaiella sp.]